MEHNTQSDFMSQLKELFLKWFPFYILKTSQNPPYKTEDSIWKLDIQKAKQLGINAIQLLQ